MDNNKARSTVVANPDTNPNVASDNYVMTVSGVIEVTSLLPPEPPYTLSFYFPLPASTSESAKSKISNLQQISRARTGLRPPLHPPSTLFSRRNCHAQAKEDTPYVKLVANDNDGQLWFGMDGQNKLWTRDARKSVVTKFTPGFHLIQILQTGNRDTKGRLYAGMATCKTSDPSSCGAIVNFKPVMTWPPVCGDAVKYAYTGKGFRSDIGDLGEQM